MSFAAPTLAAPDRLPSRLIASSDGLGWSDLLARVYDEPAVAEEFTTQVTPDLLVVAVLEGSRRIESRAGGGWESALYRPGTIGVTAAGSHDELRWRGAPGQRRRSLHVHLPAALLSDTSAALGLPGTAPAQLDALLLDDHVVGSIVQSVHVSMRQAAGALVADSLAQALAARLLTAPRAGVTAMVEPARAGVLDNHTVTQVVEYMRDHLAEPVSLDDLAHRARLSKYHFLRMFTAATGATPYQQLTRLRMERAAQMLQSGRHTVAHVALTCGFRTGAGFAVAFRRHFGTVPSSLLPGTATSHADTATSRNPQDPPRD